MSYAGQATTLPGFRKGHVPEPVLYRHFEQEIATALMERLTAEYFFREIYSMDIRFASGPYVTDFRFAEGRPFEVDTEYEVFAPFELGEYRGLKVIRQPEQVTDASVEFELQRRRIDVASVRTLEPRPVKEMDTVSVTFRGIGEEPKLSFFDEEVVCLVDEDDPFKLGPFAIQLKGLEPGVETEISAQCAESYHYSEAAGKTVRCNAIVHAIQELDLPELDDEFARDVGGGYETLDELRSDLRRQLEEQAVSHADLLTRQEVIVELTNLHGMDLPYRYATQRMQRYAERLAAEEEVPAGERKLSREETGLQVACMISEQVLDRIADVEDISVAPDELQAEIRARAQAASITPEAARQEMEASGQLGTLQADIRRSKALRLVIEAGVPVDDEEEEAAEGREAPEAESAPAPLSGTDE